MVQIACGPISGWLVQKQGSAGPLFVGMLILLASTVTFAFAGPDYSTLLGARAVQGIGSSFVAGAGMALLADIHSDDKARGEAMGSATAGVALGVLLSLLYRAAACCFSEPLCPGKSGATRAAVRRRSVPLV